MGTHKGIFSHPTLSWRTSVTGQRPDDQGKTLNSKNLQYQLVGLRAEAPPTCSAHNSQIKSGANHSPWEQQLHADWLSLPFSEVPKWKAQSIWIVGWKCEGGNGG